MNKYIKKTFAFTFAAIMAIGISAEFPYKAEAAKTLSQLQDERNALAKETKEAKAQLEELKNKQLSVQEELDAVDKLLVAAQDEVNKAQTDLADVTARLENSQAELEKATDAKESQLEVFGERLRFFYEQGDVGYLDIIFEAESFSDLLIRMQYVQDIMAYDNNLLESLKENEKIINEKTLQIAEEQETAQALLDLQEQKKNEIEATRQEKETLMASYMQDEEKYQQIVEMNEEASREVERLIAQATRSSSSSGSTYVYTGGQLNWPVPSRAASPSSLSSGFVYRKRPIGSGYESHTGYDIPAGYGADIVAAEAGTVIYSGWMNGYGYTIMINHGGGLVTLYGHNSSLVVSKGQSVSRGQVIAKCGSTGNSTGNHCHFEVRVNGSAVSPESYLGVANIAY